MLNRAVRVLLIGDIVGQPGREIVCQRIAELRSHYGLDVVIANAENVAGGSGITPEIYRALRDAGVDCVTLGDHIYRRRQITGVLEQDDRIVKPANFPAEAHGRCFTLVPLDDGPPVAVLSLLGRVFMRPVDCPLVAAERVLGELPQDVRMIVVDYHAEATSDMQILGRFLDGRVSAVLGTHTHVTTADEQIFAGGTAFQCDVGMTGPHLSILGRRIDRVLETTRTFYPTPFDVATDDVQLHATLVQLDPLTGRAQGICRICVRPDQPLAPDPLSDPPHDSDPNRSLG